MLISSSSKSVSHYFRISQLLHLKKVWGTLNTNTFFFREYNKKISSNCSGNLKGNQWPVAINWALMSTVKSCDHSANLLVLHKTWTMFIVYTDAFKKEKAFRKFGVEQRTDSSSAASKSCLQTETLLVVTPYDPIFLSFSEISLIFTIFHMHWFQIVCWLHQPTAKVFDVK